MKWRKHTDPIFVPNHHYDWMVSHASLPVMDRVDASRLRIYFGTRDARGRSLPGYIEVDADAPYRVLYVHDTPVLPLGRLGTFDDNGITPSWVVTRDGRKYLYYIGWNPQITVSYRLAIGLAISDDGGRTYSKCSDGPICDRSLEEPFFCTAPCVLLEGDVWRMWYVSCTKWAIIHARAEPFYHVKYAESADGIHWTRRGQVCVDYDESTEAIGRPCVFKENGIYRMLYSYRSATDYRTDRQRSYRLGYAESVNGMTWVRRDSEVGIDRSAHGWDSDMIEYCYVYRHRGETYMLYNGNGFGHSGFGYAVLEREHAG